LRLQLMRGLRAKLLGYHQRHAIMMQHLGQN